MGRLGLALSEAKNDGRERPAGKLRLPRLYVRPAPLSQGWPLVSWRQSVDAGRDPM